MYYHPLLFFLIFHFIWCEALKLKNIRKDIMKDLEVKEDDFRNGQAIPLEVKYEDQKVTTGEMLTIEHTHKAPTVRRKKERLVNVCPCRMYDTITYT